PMPGYPTALRPPTASTVRSTNQAPQQQQQQRQQQATKAPTKDRKNRIKIINLNTGEEYNFGDPEQHQKNNKTSVKSEDKEAYSRSLREEFAMEVSKFRIEIVDQFDATVRERCAEKRIIAGCRQRSQRYRSKRFGGIGDNSAGGNSGGHRGALYRSVVKVPTKNRIKIVNPDTGEEIPSRVSENCTSEYLLPFSKVAKELSINGPESTLTLPTSRKTEQAVAEARPTKYTVEFLKSLRELPQCKKSVKVPDNLPGSLYSDSGFPNMTRSQSAYHSTASNNFTMPAFMNAGRDPLIAQDCLQISDLQTKIPSKAFLDHIKSSNEAPVDKYGILKKHLLDCLKTGNSDVVIKWIDVSVIELRRYKSLTR
ncbi:hypothetical protein U1Q18_052077, partial [Sarracenia purpurea var. burkii]